MPDDLKITEPLDKKRININEPYEVNYWKKKFGVSTDELLKAVKAVGTSAEAVEKYLKNK